MVTGPHSGSTPSPRSVLIVGAGAFGLCAAITLRSRGWLVTVVDPGPLPRDAAASTDVSKIVRMDYGDDAHHTALAARALAAWPRWNEMFGERVYHESGFAVLSRTTMCKGQFEYDSHAMLRQRGEPLVRLDRDSIADRFPAFADSGCIDGYWNPRAGWVQSGRTSALLAQLAAAQGVQLRTGESCHHLIERNNRVAGLVTNLGTTLLGDCVLVAAGAWTPFLLPELQPFLRATGQPVVHFQVDEPSAWQPPRFPVFACDIAATGWYGFPALADGLLKIGNHGVGRPIHPDAPRIVQPEEIERARDFVRATLPALARAPIVGTRLCLYCDSADGDFLIDWHRDRAGLAIASGDSGHGFKFAPVLGELIADVIERRDNPQTARYRWRDSVRPQQETARAR